MDKSETIGKLATALVAFQAEARAVPKTEVNPFFKSHYAGLAGIWDNIRAPLAKNGLAVSQLMDDQMLNTVLMHTSGEWLASRYPITAKAQDPQGIGSAVTYARRYALSAILGIVADDDDDGEAAQGRKVERQPSKPAPQTTPPAAATTPAKEHWCAEHNTEFFMRGKMKSFAHPIKVNGQDTGEWCHEHTDTIPEFEPEATQAQPTQPVQTTPAPVVATAKRPDRASKLAATYPQEKTSADAVTEKDVTTIYQLKQMCFKLWKMQPADVLAELGVKADADLAEKPWDCFLRIKAVKAGPTG